MGRSKPAWQSENINKALKATISWRYDEIKLEEIENNALLEDIRNAAKSFRQALLLKKATDYAYKKEVSVEAVKKITDQAILGKIAKMGLAHSEAYSIAACKLTDQTLLTAVVLHSINIEAPNIAIKKITVQENLKEIVMNTTKYDYAVVALENITDQYFIAEVAISHSIPLYRSTAINLLTDQTTLADVVMKSNDPTVFLRAIERLANPQPILIEIAKTGRSWLYELAIEKIADQSILREIAYGSDNYHGGWRSRVAAIRGLTDLTVLEDLANNDSDKDISREADKRINLLEWINKSYKNDGDT